MRIRTLLLSAMLFLLLCGFPLNAEVPQTHIASIGVEVVPRDTPYAESIAAIMGERLKAALLRTARFSEIFVVTADEIASPADHTVYSMRIGSVNFEGQGSSATVAFSADITINAYPDGYRLGGEPGKSIHVPVMGLGDSGEAAVLNGGDILDSYIESIIADIPLPGSAPMVYGLYNDYPVIISDGGTYRTGDELLLVNWKGEDVGLAEVGRIIPIGDVVSGRDGITAEEAAELRILYSDIPLSAGTAVMNRGATRVELSFSPTWFAGIVGGDLKLNLVADSLLGPSFSSTDRRLSLLVGAGVLVCYDDPYPLGGLLTIPQQSLLIRALGGISFSAVPFPRYRLNGAGWKLFSRSRITLEAAVTAGFREDLLNSTESGFYFGNYWHGGVSWYISPSWMLHAGAGFEIGYVPAAGSAPVISSPTAGLGVTFRPAE